MVFILAAILLSGIVSGGRIERQASQPETFVASIKLNTSGRAALGGIMMQPGGRLVATNATLKDLVTVAYRQDTLDYRLMAGGPEWFDRDRFDVNVKADADVLPPGVLQTLLEQRFALRTHIEMKISPVYRLVLDGRDGKLGPSLTKSDVDCEAVARDMRDGKMPPLIRVPSGAMYPCGAQPSVGRIYARAFTIAQFARTLSPMADRVVVDETGLTGAYDADLAWTPERVGASVADPSAASGIPLVTAIREQLGLRLVAGSAPVPVLVIDRAERPTED